MARVLDFIFRNFKALVSSKSILFISIMSLAFVTGCADTTQNKYEMKTQGSTLSDWRGTYVSNRVVAGVVLNSVPVLHLPGLVLDTIYVWTGIDDLIYGNGAIIARNYACDGLVTKDDYFLFFAWNGKHRSLVNNTFSQVHNLKSNAGDVASDVGLTLSAASRKLIEGKISKKVSTKIGVKIAVKVIAKGLAGFVPLLGPIAAGAINFFILNDLDKDSRRYFEEKAKLVCT